MDWKRLARIASAASLSTMSCKGCEPLVEQPPTTEDAERYAEALCAASAVCECGRFGPGPADCESAVREGFELTAAQSSLSFDRDCFEEFVAYLESEDASRCEMATWAGPACLVFTGSLGPGEPCRFDLRNGYGLVVSECVGGNFCFGGVCRVADRAVVPLGAACSQGRGVCEGESYCAPEARCSAFGSLGDDCDSPFGCGATSYCSGITAVGDVGVCAPLPGEGDVCEFGTPASCGFGPESCSPDEQCGLVYPPVCGALWFPGGPLNASDWIP